MSMFVSSALCDPLCNFPHVDDLCWWCWWIFLKFQFRFWTTFLVCQLNKLIWWQMSQADYSFSFSSSFLSIFHLLDQHKVRPRDENFCCYFHSLFLVLQHYDDFVFPSVGSKILTGYFINPYTFKLLVFFFIRHFLVLHMSLSSLYSRGCYENYAVKSSD